MIGVEDREIPNVVVPSREVLGETSLLQMSEDQLQAMDAPQLYDAINEHLDSAGFIDKIKNNLRFRMALIMAWKDALDTFAAAPKDSTYQEINSLMMGSEAIFVESLQKLGVHVDVRSEITKQEFAAKPHIFMSTHQGGGLETYVLGDLMRRAGAEQYRYVVKDELVDLPIVGKIIEARNPIRVSRKSLNEEKKLPENERGGEVAKVAAEIVETLKNGESVLFFFEGTRSKSGAICHTANRREWCYKLTDAIKLAAAKYPDLDYGNALVVLDMLSVLPVAVEKKVFAPTRINGDCTVTIMNADGLSTRENEADMYDQKTLFGAARTLLKDNLIERVKRYQKA